MSHRLRAVQRTRCRLLLTLLADALDDLHRWLRDHAVRPGSRAADPFVAGSHGRASERGAGFFDIEGLYGGTRFWSASAGIRVSWRTAEHRMGRYGAAIVPVDHHTH